MRQILPTLSPEAMIERAQRDAILRGGILLGKALKVEGSGLRDLAVYAAQLEARCLELEVEVGLDPLTEIANRRRLEYALDRELSRSGRTGIPTTVLFLDVDHFKQFNDKYGHDVGDEVLRAVAGILAKETRKVDTVGRFGGEEFVVVLSGTDARGGAQAAGMIRRKIATLRVGSAMGVTVSIGVAQAILGETRESVLKAADVAMYTAKAAGRNRVDIADKVSRKVLA